MDKQAQQWERLGATDPYWAVLTRPGTRHGKWDPQEFYETGQREVEDVLARMQALGLAKGTERALDFGCGVGRLSSALAAHFDAVTAVDVSESMLREARRMIESSHPNIPFVHNTRPDLECVGDMRFDFIYSNIVLQHIPREAQYSYVREFGRILKRGGIAVFQTPARLNFRRPTAFLLALMPNRALNVMRRAAHGRHGVMEMHCLPEDDVVRALAEHEVAIVHKDGNEAAGPAFVSHRYFARKT